MRANEFITEAVKQRLDAKCWKGKHKEGTKIKGGVRVNNCVPNESIEEMDKSQKGAAGWNIDDYDYSKGKWTQGKIITAKDAVKSAAKDFDAAFNNADKKKPKPVNESYWTKLQNERNTRLNSLVNELAESITK